MNSLMIYYVSNLSVIQNLNGKRIDEILLIIMVIEQIILFGMLTI